MRMILAAAVLAALALSARAQDNRYGPQWHFMDHSADMRLPIRAWCVPNTAQWSTCSHESTEWRTAGAAPAYRWGWPYGGATPAAVRR
jgi:hypothetical protein